MEALMPTSATMKELHQRATAFDKFPSMPLMIPCTTGVYRLRNLHHCIERVHAMCRPTAKGTTKPQAQSMCSGLPMILNRTSAARDNQPMCAPACPRLQRGK
mmetsp:Transcript_57386/g.178352  ORF Transcript_57386/g.178352 Transcript_57386/m.178352 type:complete len:102 (-) Transcript_57386:2383-2688(-)